MDRFMQFREMSVCSVTRNIAWENVELFKPRPVVDVLTTLTGI